MISMAKSMTVGKRENEKKRLAKREEKLKKKESKKLSGKANSFEDMIAYVDENGMITSTPPTEDIKKEEINPDEIIIATPKKEEEEPSILDQLLDKVGEYVDPEIDKLPPEEQEAAEMKLMATADALVDTIDTAYTVTEKACDSIIDSLDELEKWMDKW